MLTGKFSFAVALVALIFFSCNNPGNDEGADSVKSGVGAQTNLPRNKFDSAHEADSVHALSSAGNTTATATHLSKADSTRIADSIQRTKNTIRDFN